MEIILHVFRKNDLFLEKICIDQEYYKNIHNAEGVNLTLKKIHSQKTKTLTQRLIRVKGLHKTL